MKLRGTPDQVAGGVFVVCSADSAQALLGCLAAVPGPFGLDCETVGVDPGKQSPVGNGRIVCWSVAWCDGTLGQHSITGRLLVQRAYIPAAYLELFRSWLEDATVHKVGHNIWRFDRHVFANHGIELRGILADTLRLSQMLYNVKGYDHGLEALARRYLGYDMADYAGLFSRPVQTKPKVYKREGYRMPGKKAVVQVRTLYAVGTVSTFSWRERELIPLTEITGPNSLYPGLQHTLADYASLDAKATLELYPVLQAALARVPARGCNMAQLHDRFWNPICEVVSNSERRGIALDTAVCAAGEARAATDAAAITAQLAPWVEPEFNWGSPEQLKDLLYNRLAMPLAPIKGTIRAIEACDRGERSVAEASLYWLELNARDDHERAMLALVRKRRKTLRLHGYLRDLPGFVGPDGRVHCVMGPDTTTGRLAARCPPLQQMPGKEPYGIRRAFVAAPGHSLVVADFSQLEVYVLAHMLQRLFGDVSISRALESGDVYGTIAKVCWPGKLEGIEASAIKHHPDPEVRKLRDLAKIVVLATNYGKTAQGLAISLLDEQGVSVGLEYAVNLLATYGDAFPGVVEFQHWSGKFAREHGGIYTLAGRWRPIPEARAEQGALRNRGNRIASNTPIQGSAMDITGGAMLDIEADSELTLCGARQLLQIHDELIVEVPSQHAEFALDRVCQHMTAVRFGLEVQLKVEAKIAPNWAQGK